MDEVKDFLGTPIREGDRAIRVDVVGHFKRFVKVTVAEIDTNREYYGEKVKDCVAVITDGNTRVGWTYPERLITQESLKIKI